MLPIPLSVAQAPPESRRPPDGGTRQVLVSILIPSVPNAPFSATVVTEWIRQLADGSTITLGNRRAIARDKAGRIFQERRLLVPNDGKHESIVTQIEISDPVAHDLYICVPQEHVCQVEVFSPPEFIHSGEPANFATRRPGSPTLEDLGKQSLAVWKPRARVRRRSSSRARSGTTLQLWSGGSIGTRPSLASISSASFRIREWAHRVLKFPISCSASLTASCSKCREIPRSSTCGSRWTSHRQTTSLPTDLVVALGGASCAAAPLRNSLPADDTGLHNHENQSFSFRARRS
jgi:hypothetical protein